MDFRNQTPQHENTPTHKMFGLVLFLKVLVGNGVVVCIDSGPLNNDRLSTLMLSSFSSSLMEGTSGRWKSNPAAQKPTNPYESNWGGEGCCNSALTRGV